MKKSENGTVDLHEDSPDVVKCLIQYLYEGEYDPVCRLCAKQSSFEFAGNSMFPHNCSTDNWNNLDCRAELCEHHQCYSNCDCDYLGYICEECHPKPPAAGPEQLLVHTKVYEIADKYNVVELKDPAKVKYRIACQHYWSEPSFAVSALHALSATPEDDKGLRDIMYRAIAQNMREPAEKPEIKALLTEFGGLAFDLLKANIDASWT